MSGSVGSPFEITFYPNPSCLHSCGYPKVDQTLWICLRGLILNDFLQNPDTPGVNNICAGNGLIG